MTYYGEGKNGKLQEGMKVFGPNREFRSHLWILPTGNWSPARLDLDWDLPFTLPPLPRPDILVDQDLKPTLQGLYSRKFLYTKYTYRTDSGGQSYSYTVTKSHK